MSETDRQRWDARYRAQAVAPGLPAASLVALAEHLPTSGRALDAAGGSGRNALWLAERGLDVTLADISEVAIELARKEARRRDLPLRRLAVDLESSGIPAGPWDLILFVNYLGRPLFPAVPRALGPGGRLVVIHPTRSNLTRHERPGPSHLLEDGELPGLVDELEILLYDEGWSQEGRHEARLVARRERAG